MRSPHASASVTRGYGARPTMPGTPGRPPQPRHPSRAASRLHRIGHTGRTADGQPRKPPRDSTRGSRPPHSRPTTSGNESPRRPGRDDGGQGSAWAATCGPAIRDRIRSGTAPRCGRRRPPGAAAGRRTCRCSGGRSGAAVRAPARCASNARCPPLRTGTELFHVIAQIIRRHIGAHGTVPVCIRYDLHERSGARTCTAEDCGRCPPRRCGA